MHFYYLDEAGCTGKDLQNSEQPIFVLGGISVRDEGWNKTQEDFSRIISHYFNGNLPANFELHAEQLLSPKGDGPFSGHDRDMRNALALEVLSLLSERSHDVHIYAIDKKKLDAATKIEHTIYYPKTPYFLAYDYMLTQINQFIKDKLGRSARGMLIIDNKDSFHSVIESISRFRRFEDVKSQRIKSIVEFSYPVDSSKNPMIQISDLVVFCAKKFLEIDCGYRENYQPEAKSFFGLCYSIIHERNQRKTLVPREGKKNEHFNALLKDIQASPSRNWKRKYLEQ